MGKPVDFAYIQKMMEDNPDDWYTGEEAAARMDAVTKKMLGVTGPNVSTRDIPGGGFVVDIDFDDIVERATLPHDGEVVPRG